MILAGSLIPKTRLRMILTMHYAAPVRSTIFVIPLLLTLAACTPAAPASGPANPKNDQAPAAIATTTQLGSIVGDITKCAGTTSATLMGPGDDPHDFSLASNQVAALTKAKLVVASGLGLEAGMSSALEGAKADGATIFEVAPLLDPLPYQEVHSSGDTHAEDDHGAEDPHVHMDVARMARASGLIGEKLAEVTGDQKYAQCGTEVEAKLQQTDAEVRQILSVIPAEKRVLITDHEAYHYFADSYDFRIAGVVIPGGSTDAQPSSSELADLVKVVREDKVSAIFSNNTVNPRLVEAVAQEAGTDIKVVQLYEGSVGPAGSGAETYSGMMLANARLIADALK